MDILIWGWLRITSAGRERGAGLMEYGLLAVLVGVALITVLDYFTSTVDIVFKESCEAFSEAGQGKCS